MSGETERSQGAGTAAAGFGLRHGGGLVAALCAAEVLGMAGFSGFAALLPLFTREWGLSNTEAGWISGIFYAGYVAAVPMLVTLTDRVDPRRIYLLSTALGAVASLGYAFLAEGFWSALLWRALAGVGLAGTYMPGLKALTDRLGGMAQSRAVAFYTSSFGIGGSLSYILIGQVDAAFGWRAAFAAAALGSLLAYALAAGVLRPAPPVPSALPPPSLLDFRPALRNRNVVACMVAYAAHNYELFGFRSWIVAFLAFSGSLHGAGGFGVDATLVAAGVTVVSLPGSILGNEVALRLGRRGTIVAAMFASALLACVIGFTAPLSAAVVVPLALVYGTFVSADSSALTSTLVASAEPRYRGMTMALYSSIGFVGSFLGPLAFGVALDFVGGDTALGWGAAFAVLGLGVAIGPLTLLAVMRPTRDARLGAT